MVRALEFFTCSRVVDPLMNMKLSNHFILYFTCFFALCINSHGSSSFITGSSLFINVPFPLFRESLVSTMEQVRNLAYTFSRIHADIDDDAPNLSVSVPYCANLLGETARLMNWTLSAIDQQYTQGYKQIDTTVNVVSHARTLLNRSLGNQEICTEMIDGTKYFTAARRLKQVTTSMYDIVGMLRVPQSGPDFSKAAESGGSSLGTARIFDGVKVTQKPNLIVSQDGRGHFKRIMDAIKAAPSHSTRQFVILVKRGVYNEYVNIDETKSNLVLMGERMGATIITGSKRVGGALRIYDTATFAVRALGFVAMNIAFENNAGPSSQAIAVLSSGDHSTFYRCKITGYQDTLNVQAGRQFFRECYISGTVDFIFGFGSAVFQKCYIYAKKNPKGGTSVIAAQGASSPSDTSAFSFHMCIITGDPNPVRSDPTHNGAYLGRSWGTYARTVFIQCTMFNIRQEGWLEWQGKGVDKLYFGEYNNNGPCANVAGRVKWPGYHVMKPSDAASFTAGSLLGGHSWLPALGIPLRLGLGR